MRRVNGGQMLLALSDVLFLFTAAAAVILQAGAASGAVPKGRAALAPRGFRLCDRAGRADALPASGVSGIAAAAGALGRAPKIASTACLGITAPGIRLADTVGAGNASSADRADFFICVLCRRLTAAGIGIVLIHGIKPLFALFERVRSRSVYDPAHFRFSAVSGALCLFAVRFAFALLESKKKSLCAKKRKINRAKRPAPSSRKSRARSKAGPPLLLLRQGKGSAPLSPRTALPLPPPKAPTAKSA